jgi:hypothetical protein
MLSTLSSSAPRLSRRVLTLGALVLMAGAAACGDDDDDAGGITGPGSNVARGATIFGVDGFNTLVAFGRDNPTTGDVRSIPITGLVAGETVVGIDFRANATLAADRLLYAVTSTSRIVTIDTVSGAATAIGTPFTPAASGTSFGLDFNPTADRLRLHSDADQNLRLNQLTGGAGTADSVLAFAVNDVNTGSPNVVGTAYTNTVPGATTTELFGIDSDRDVLVFIADPNRGRLTTRGALGINTTTAVGFDIVGAGAGTAFASLTPQDTFRSRLYRIDLTTGAATAIGDINYARPLVGIAIAP